LFNMKGQPIKYGLLLLLVLSSVSCVYFNTFYNARKYFESAQSHAIRETGRPAPRAIQDYDKVIEKCTYILTEYPDSRWADNALFLLSKSMYYKKQNLIQARERFNDFLRVFPDSEFVPEVNIYIAKIDYEMNDKEDSYRLLQDLINNPEYSTHHPQVLLLKSEYHIKDKDYLLAQNTLQKLIEDYPDSKEFEQAYLNLGRSYLDNDNYRESKEIFNQILRTRAPRRTKLNAQYYMALNLYHLEDFEAADELVKRLIRDEYETAMFTRLNMLQARIHVGKNQYNQAESLFKSIIENNRRTAVAAEAAYHLAEMYFLHLLDYSEAIEFYNRVQSEMRNSEFADNAVARSAVVSQIVQFSRQDRDVTAKELINEQFKLAEYYLYVMALPDSALSVYSSIEPQKERLVSRRDSLLVQLDEMRAVAADFDSLAVITDYDITEPDELTVADADTLAVSDSLLVEAIDELEEETIEPQAAVDSLEADLQLIEEDIEIFSREFIPYANFASAWVWLNKHKNRSRAEEISENLKNKYPGNPYTFAAERMLKGEKIRIATTTELDLESRYEEAMVLVESNPAETVSLLEELHDDIAQVQYDQGHIQSGLITKLYNKTLFSLGYVHYFNLADTTQSKTYFDEILTAEDEDMAEYAQFVRKFYDNDVFIINDSFDIEEEAVLDPPEDDSTELPDKKTEEQDYSPEIGEERLPGPHMDELFPGQHSDRDRFDGIGID
jgi:TolA-binding protein